MHTKLQGKKLLILAGGPNLVTLVERAQHYGVYVIVTDYYDKIDSPAKSIADEYWDISWADVDTLEAKCREVGVDGITSGYSENTIENCIELCERLRLPCYCTREQLAFTRDKLLFKEVCRANGVQTVKEYDSPESVDSFPVILKPVDRAGSIGVGIAHNRDELYQAYEYAMSKSFCKKVIIEKYMTGTKIDVYYEIRGGKVTLLSSDDVIMAASNGDSKVVQSAWILPSRRHKEIVEKADPGLRRMIQNLGIQDGYMFISGFDDDGDFTFFESGFRLCGGHLYEYYMDKGDVNNLDIFIFHALLGTTEDVIALGEKDDDLKCVTINIYAKAGVIGEISGLENIAAMERCRFALNLGKIGQVCSDDKAILDKIAMYYFCGKDARLLEEDVAAAYGMMHVVSNTGEDMIYDRIDEKQIRTWWEK